jgi:hypothetical protein
VTITNTGTAPTSAWEASWFFNNGEQVEAFTGNGFNSGLIALAGATPVANGQAFTVSNLNGYGAIPAGGTTKFQVLVAVIGNAYDPTVSCAATTNVPGAPTGVTATAGNASATVTWTAPASNGGSTITGYTVTSSGGQTCTTAGYTTLGCVLTGLTNGTSYTFTVTARNGNGSGVTSVASNAVTPATVPSAPTGVSAQAGAGQATVTWTAPASNGSAITSYIVTSSGGQTCTAGAGQAMLCIVTSLTPGVSYTFTVKAVNGVGSSAASVASNAVTPTGAATVPGAPTSVVAINGNTIVKVSWAAPTTGGGAITAYTVTSNSGQTCTTTGALTCTVTGLTNGVLYTFTVTATNSVGTGPASAVSNGAIPFTVPNIPTGVTATTTGAGAGQANVSWIAPAFNGGAPITGYTVTASGSGGQTCTTTTALTCTVSGLTPGTSYTFTVTARNDAGAGSASTASNSITVVQAGPVCTATVTPQSTPWMSGSNGYAQIVITVTNSGSVAIKGWTVKTIWPKTMTLNGSAANGTLTGSATNTFTVTNASYNGAIAIGASVPSAQDPNFQVYGAGAYAAPTSVSCSAT